MGATPDSFGPFVVDRDLMALLREDKALAIGQRGYALLTALLDTDGVATKAALMEAGWPGAYVEESNLTVQIAALRKALGSRDDGQEWIVTVPRVGYRLLRGNVSAIAEAPAEERIPAIAVLPFQNLSGDAQQDYFADGVVDDIITALNRFRSILVTSRNSSFVYKGTAVDLRKVAKDLGVRYLLEGTVRRSGDRLRLTAQLVDGETGTHLWADKYEGSVADIFEVQDRITENVVSIVEPRIRRAEIERSRRKPPASLTAYDLTLRALPHVFKVTPEDNAEAYRLLVQAIALEPDYATALNNMTWVLEFRHDMGWPSLTGDDRTNCIAFAHRALEHANGDPLILAQVGVALCNVGGEYEIGLQTVRLAVEGNPNNALVLNCAAIANLHCGSLDLTLALAQRAVRLSPGDPTKHWALTALAHANVIMRNYEEALRWADQSLAVNSNFDSTYWMLIAANALLGRTAEAERWLGRFRGMQPTVTIAAIRQGQPARYPERIAGVLDGLRLAGLPEE